ncbi:STAS domain-containing protein [Streptomyces purpureus]|uniref:STAS domain-containing protein n=1 Tax=Streptomyces purpureus TaxID=1951 RepID=UPI00035FF707|nr:STAS domain-containing protein [Streptomyces purpureus]
MTFEAYLGFTGSAATVYLSGDLTDRQVPALRRLIEQALTRPPSRLVLKMADLTGVSAAAIRCLAFAQQQLPPGAQIVLDGAGEDVRRVLAASGLDRAVTLVTQTPPTSPAGPAGPLAA